MDTGSQRIRNEPGESTILATRSSPRPLRSKILVVEAWARTWPPAGFLPSAPANKALAPGSDITWFVCSVLVPMYISRS